MSVRPSVGPLVGRSVGRWRFCKKQGKIIIFEQIIVGHVITSSYNHFIIMRTHRWPFGPCFSFQGKRTCEPTLEDLKNSEWLKYPRHSVKTRPLRPTMRPHDDEMIVWWRDYVRFFLTFSFFDLLKYIHGCVTDRSMDRQTDGWIDRLIEMQGCI